MRDHAQPGVLPLRPMTTGELLDAAVVLLRQRGGVLLLAGGALAASEQAILFPLRRLADVDSSFLPGEQGLAAFGYVVLAGLALEAVCIAVLGAVAAHRATRALLGTAAPMPAAARPGRVAAVAVIAGTACASTGWAFLVLPVPLQLVGLMLAVVITALVWPFVYGLVGLAAPAAVVDQLGAGRAIVRSIRLASRGMQRGMWIRVLGYCAWLGIRLGLGAATLAAIELFYSSPSATIDNVIMGVTWLVVNALAYPMLGCLDVAVHLDVRMRTEGLDIALGRSVRRGVATGAALAVPHAVPRAVPRAGSGIAVP